MNIRSAIKAYERLRDEGIARTEKAKIAMAIAALMAPETKDIDSACRWVQTRIDPDAEMPICALAEEA